MVNLSHDDPTGSWRLSPEEAIDRTAPGPDQVFDSLLHRLRTSRVLYYPGAGSDTSPAMRFARTGAIDTVVYCDYSDHPAEMVFEQICAELGEDTDRRLPELGHRLPRDLDPLRHPVRHLDGTAMRDILASELGQHSRADFFPSARGILGRRGERDSNPQIGQIGEIRLPGAPGKRLSFLYLDTEAIQTFIHVWGMAGCAPLVVVVQNHGKGGLWTSLGGDCLMYTASPRLPRYLYVGDDMGSEPWPHYRRISHEVVDLHSLHRSSRSLWECTCEDCFNPDSPLGFLASPDRARPDDARAARLQPFIMPEDIRQRAGVPPRSP